MTADGGDSWTEVAIGDISDDRYRVFSLNVRCDEVLVGLGFNTQTLQGTMQSASGFLYSGDGGHTFEERFPQIDTRIDTFITYGNTRLRALPAAWREAAPPYVAAVGPPT